MKSRSDAQLRGEVSGLSDCPPQKYLNGNTSNEINPCGLAAWSYFNDTYVFSTRNGSGVQPINISTQNIAWESDKRYRFSSKNPVANFNTDPLTRGGASITTPTVGEDERFINWMRTSALSTFRKLWVRGRTDVKAPSPGRIASHPESQNHCQRSRENRKRAQLPARSNRFFTSNAELDFGPLPVRVRPCRASSRRISPPGRLCTLTWATTGTATPSRATSRSS